ncbi:MAG TPA: glycosyltransferase [Mycobacterium sp.]|nr:glycosyltransferase [Mycobacterium sp.]HTX95431.1 glycosyltransferase [Mycobacterium sp.]
MGAIRFGVVEALTSGVRGNTGRRIAALGLVMPAASPQPSVAIVIPAHNEERFIGKRLASCIDQTSLPDEIIVVNNRSTDGTASVVRRYQAEQPHIDVARVLGLPEPAPDANPVTGVDSGDQRQIVA